MVCICNWGSRYLIWSAGTHSGLRNSFLPGICQDWVEKLSNYQPLKTSTQDWCYQDWSIIRCIRRSKHRGRRCNGAHLPLCEHIRVFEGHVIEWHNLLWYCWRHSTVLSSHGGSSLGLPLLILWRQGNRWRFQVLHWLRCTLVVVQSSDGLSRWLRSDHWGCRHWLHLSGKSILFLLHQSVHFLPHLMGATFNFVKRCVVVMCDYSVDSHWEHCSCLLFLLPVHFVPFLSKHLTRCKVGGLSLLHCQSLPFYEISCKPG